IPGIIARYNSGIFASASLCELHGLPTTLQKDVDMLSFTCSQRIRAVSAFVQYKYTHCHTKFGQQITNTFLFFDGAAGKAVILYATEPLIVGELNLIQDILARMVFELPLMGAIIQIKRPCLLPSSLYRRKSG